MIRARREGCHCSEESQSPRPPWNSTEANIFHIWVEVIQIKTMIDAAWTKWILLNGKVKRTWNLYPHVDPFCLNMPQYPYGLPRWFSGKESTCQCRRCMRHKFDPWVGKIPWRRKWQPAPVFLSGESHGQRNLAGYSPWSLKRVGNNLASKQQQNP